MSLLLRTCLLGTKCRNFMKVTFIGRNFACMKCNKTNLKRFLPALQVRERSTSNDEKSKDLELIYTGMLNKKILVLKAVTLSTSAAGMYMLPLILFKSKETHSVLMIGYLIMMGFFSFGAPILIHLITRKYALNIYHNTKKDSYIVEVYKLFLRKKQIEFTPADVVLPTIDNMFSNVIIKNHKIFMDCRHFTDPKHYYNIMGYDKPLSFRFEGDDEKTVPFATDKMKNSDNKQ